MNNFNLFIRPVITEKATQSEAIGKYQFFVRKNATKIDIAAAFKKLYGVDVTKINMMRTPVKLKTGASRRTSIKKHELKKVIITTKSQKKIDALKPKLK